MARLTATSPCAGLDLTSAGGCELSEVDYGSITSVAPFRGREREVSDALKAAIGSGLPAPNRVVGKAGARVAWSGLGQILVLGPPVAPEGAAVTDQSDAWACLALTGRGSVDVLARLTPLDLRDSRFRRGHAARSLMGHMPCLFLRPGMARYEMLVFRSMARTAVHELNRAMEDVAAQNAL